MKTILKIHGRSWRLYFNTLGRRCTAKLTQDPTQVVNDHGNDIDSTVFNIETIANSIVNINN